MSNVMEINRSGEPDIERVEVLFVGGPKDGCRHLIETRDGMPRSTYLVPIPDGMGYKRRTYHLIPFHHGRNYPPDAAIRWIYLWEIMTTNDLVTALVDRYPKPLQDWMK